jgi:hypothetical protein
MKYAIEMDSVAMIYIRSFIKIDSGIRKLIGAIHRHTGWRSHNPTLGKYAKEKTEISDHDLHEYLV